MGSMGHGGFGEMRADRPARSTGRGIVAEMTAARSKPKLRKVMPEVWKLVKPRLWLLIASFAIMVVNRASGLILPASARYLIDDVMKAGNMGLLSKIVGAVALATLTQAVTSYALTQLLSKAGQRLITELRMQVQAHIGRLPVAFYDENRTGTLVARIMTDVEGVRNLIGTGVIDFIGGVLTAIFAFCYLIHLSVQMTLVTFFILMVFSLILQRASKLSVRSSASAHASTRRSRAVSRNLSVASASSRDITPNRSKPMSSLAARSVSFATSSAPSLRSRSWLWPPRLFSVSSAHSSCTSVPISTPPDALRKVSTSPT